MSTPKDGKKTKGRGRPRQELPTTSAAPAPAQSQLRSTTITAETKVTPTSSSCVIQATGSSLITASDQSRTLTQSTLTSVTSHDVQGTMESLSLQHREETTRKETSMIKTLGAEFPAKPKERGTLGRPIRLLANHFKISLKHEFTVHQYDIEVTKLFGNQGEKPVLLRSVMKLMFPLLMAKLPQEYRNKVVYNFSKNLYSLKKLPFESTATYQFEIEKQLHTVKIKKINEIKVDPKAYDEPLAIQILDLIFTQNFNFSCISVNRSFFKEGQDLFTLGFGLELWRGAYSSVRPSEVGLTWNIDTANSAFLVSKNLLEVAANFYQCDYSQLKQRIENDRDGKEIGVNFIYEFKGRDIKTGTGGYRKKIQSFGPDSSYQFDWNKNDKIVKISIKDYLKQQYKIDLKYPHLPCVSLGKGGFLPMELCKTELKHQTKLTDKQTADVIRQTAVKTSERLNYIQNWINKSSINTDPVLKEFNLDVSLKLIDVDGKVLEAPDIAYCLPGPGISGKRIGENGSWDHRNLKFNKPINVEKWVLVNYASRVRGGDIDNFITSIQKIGNIHGMAIRDPLDVIDLSRKYKEDQVFKSFDEIITKYKQLNLIILILPGKTTIYNVIKTCGELKYGISTQAVQDKNVSRLSDQTISNILLKINAKLNGKNFVLSSNAQLFQRYLGSLFDKPIMIFGADVSHPSPGDKVLTESIASVVGSFDRQASLYGARLYAQKAPRGQAYEMIHDLDKMVNSLLLKFNEINKFFPHRLVFYRDGVSEGQFKLVLRHEINKIRQACQAINAAYKPAITFVVVQKRHHTRLFPVDSMDKRGKSENVPPGTVVDKIITSKDMFDFFLCSHFGIQGTSRPCRYFVLHDDNNFTMNQIQLLSHYLCHIYVRCPRSVSYPAPAYYSHLAAFRGRDYIRQAKKIEKVSTIISYEIDLHTNIRDTMFFS